MPLEAATYISELIETNPTGGDDRSTSDDHHRLIKGVLKNSFPNVNGPVNPTPAEFNLLVGATGTIWTSTNDGAGSGLDADTVDGLQASQFLRSDSSDILTGTLDVEVNQPAPANNSYAGAHVELRTTDGSLPMLGFHRSGFDAVTIFEQAGELYKNDNVDGTLQLMWHAGLSGIVTSTHLTDAAVTQAKIAAAAVGQGQLKTASGQFSSTLTNTTVALPGGEYGFVPQLYNNSSSQPGGGIGANVRTPNTSVPVVFFQTTAGVWQTVVTLVEDGNTTQYMRQRYIQASPPYDLGDGSVASFVFALVSASGQVEAVYSAREAPWHYNGPTQVKADLYRDGKGYRLRRDMSAVPFTFEEAKSDPVKLAEYMAAFKAAPVVEEEITQEIKQADMPLIPHPFMGNDLTGKTVVLLDPVCDMMWHLAEMCDCHDKFNLNELLHEGHIVVDNQPLNRAGPPGVPVIGFKWKNTRGK